MDLLKIAKDYRLSAAEVLEQLQKAKSTTNAEKLSEIKNSIVMANILLVMKVMKPYLKIRALQYEDLLAEGIIGIYTAIDKFDLSKNVQFSTYAFFWIKMKIQRFVEKTFMNGIDRYSKSIDAPCYSADDNIKLKDIIPAPAVDTTEDDIKKILHNALTTLSPREKFVLEMRYGLK